MKKFFSRIKSFSKKESVRILASLVPWVILNTWFCGSLLLIGIGLLGAGLSAPSHLSHGSEMAFGIGFMSLVTGSFLFVVALAIYAMLRFAFEKPAHK